MNTYFGASSSLAVPSLPGLRVWEVLMRSGVEAERQGDVGQAESLYLEALAVARSLIALDAGCGFSADDRMAALVVAHLNLADLLRGAERVDAAVGQLCTAHRTLMALLRDPYADPAIQIAACRHSRETHSALLAHLTEHGSHPAIVEALRAGCMPFPAHGATVH